jgi:murein DD-endopeptidase MepM/ murein hydrolase activator NlpD
MVVMTSTPASAEVTQQQLSEARADMNSKAAALSDQLTRLDAIQVQQALYEARVADLQKQITDRDREITLARLAARDQARAMYVHAGSAAAEAAADPQTITDRGTRDAYLAVVVNTGDDAVNRLASLQADSAALENQLRGMVAQQEDLANQASAIGHDMQQALSDANDQYQALYTQWQKEEAARQAAAAAAARRAALIAAGRYDGPIDSSGRACPVAGPTAFRDSWGEPRPGGRAHHGTDLMAAEGTPLVAIENGTIWAISYDVYGGNGLFIRGDSGEVYYYAHLSRYYPTITEGMRVHVNDYVGYVGHTGDATSPHLHLGWYPEGYANGPRDPYPLAVKLCR